MPVTAQEIGSTPENRQTILIDHQGGDNPIYVCWAKPDTPVTEPHWKIMRLTYDGTDHLTNVEWAGGSERYAFRASDRTVLDYS